MRSRNLNLERKDNQESLMAVAKDKCGIGRGKVGTPLSSNSGPTAFNIFSLKSNQLLSRKGTCMWGF
jgi:hypothetical protein